MLILPLLLLLSLSVLLLFLYLYLIKANYPVRANPTWSFSWIKSCVVHWGFAQVQTRLFDFCLRALKNYN